MQISTDGDIVNTAVNSETEQLPARGSSLPQDAILLGALTVVIIVFAVLSSSFLSFSNVVNTLQSATEIGILAIGELFVIITAGIDLSVGATLGLAGTVSAIALRDVHIVPLAIVIGVAAALLIGAVVGIFNGVVITYLRVTPFVVTLGTLGVCSGVTLILTNGLDIIGVPSAVSTFGNTVFLKVLTGPIIVTLVLALLAGWVLRSGIFGRWTYAIGSNRLGALESGINVRRHLIKVYALSGVLAGISGFVLMARLGDGSPLSGQNDELSAITAVVIGGASLFGGRGNMLGTVLGVVLLSVILDGLILTGVEPYWQTVATGLLLIAAVTVQSMLHRGRESDGLA